MKRSSPITLFVLAFVIFATVACMCSIFNQRQPLVFTPDQLPDALVGVPYKATINISQNDTPVGSVSLYKGTLPPGLELANKRTEDTAKITGALTQAGTYTFTINVWCLGTNTSGQAGEKQYSIVVPVHTLAGELVFSPDKLPDAQSGIPYEATISVT